MVIATLGVLAVLVVLATAGTVWLVKTRPAQEHDPDTKFWYGFAGLCVLVPTILITAAANTLSGAALMAVAAGTWLWANKLVSRNMASRAAATATHSHASEHAALAARHDAILARWSRYELDPGAAIDFPGMCDVRVPETSAFVKAVARAEELRRGPGANTTTAAGETDYREAITRLELAFHRAEQAAMAGTAG